MSDLEKLTTIDTKSDTPLSDQELAKRVGGRIMAPGDTIILSEVDYSLKKLHVGAGWDVPGGETNAMDVDLSLFLLDKNDQTAEDSDFVFYNNLSGSNDAVTHAGDNRTGIGEGDDETALIEFSGLPYAIMKITLVASIYDAEMRDQNVSMIRNGFLRLVNAENGRELIRFPIPPVENGKESYALMLGELIREGPVWMFKAMGEPVTGNLGKIATSYGIMVTG